MVGLLLCSEVDMVRSKSDITFKLNSHDQFGIFE